MSLAENWEDSARAFVLSVDRGLQQSGVTEREDVLNELRVHISALFNDGEDRALVDVLGAPEDYVKELLETDASLVGNTQVMSKPKKTLWQKFMGLSLVSKVLIAYGCYLTFNLLIVLYLWMMWGDSTEPFYPGARILLVVAVVQISLAGLYTKRGTRLLIVSMYRSIDSFWAHVAQFGRFRFATVAVHVLGLLVWWEFRAVGIIAQWTFSAIHCPTAIYSAGDPLGIWTTCESANRIMVVDLVISLVLGVIAQLCKRWTVSRILFLPLNLLAGFLVLSYIQYFLGSL